MQGHLHQISVGAIVLLLSYIPLLSSWFGWEGDHFFNNIFFPGRSENQSQILILDLIKPNFRQNLHFLTQILMKNRQNAHKIKKNVLCLKNSGLYNSGLGVFFFSGQPRTFRAHGRPVSGNLNGKKPALSVTIDRDPDKLIFVFTHLSNNYETW